MLILVVEWMKLHVYLMEKVIQPPLGFELGVLSYKSSTLPY